MLCNSRKCTVIYNAERLVIAWGRKMKKVKRYYKGTQGELGIVVNTCNTSTQENESEGLELTSQTELYQNPVSKKGVQDQKKRVQGNCMCEGGRNVIFIMVLFHRCIPMSKIMCSKYVYYIKLCFPFLKKSDTFFSFLTN
jgi:hypothetical protein